MKAVTVSDFYLFDALLFDLCKAVETSRYNIIAILINSHPFNLTFNTAQEYCLTVLFWDRRIPGSKFNSPVQNQHRNSWQILFPSARASSWACKKDLNPKTSINYYIIPYSFYHLRDLDVLVSRQFSKLCHLNGKISETWWSSLATKLFKRWKSPQCRIPRMRTVLDLVKILFTVC